MQNSFEKIASKLDLFLLKTCLSEIVFFFRSQKGENADFLLQFVSETIAYVLHR